MRRALRIKPVDLGLPQKPHVRGPLTRSGWSAERGVFVRWDAWGRRNVQVGTDWEIDPSWTGERAQSSAMALNVSRVISEVYGRLAESITAGNPFLLRAGGRR